jgi:drug/metabolite transporter (DMT)-like permease
MKKERIYPIIGMIICTVFSSFGSFFIKRAANDIGFNPETWFNYNIFIGLISLLFGFIILMLSIRVGQVSKLHGIMSLSYIWVLLIGYFFLGEHIGLNKIFSIVLIIFGVIFVTWQN